MQVQDDTTASSATEKAEGAIPNVAERLATFLEKYKPIFEVGAATLLGVMAIVVSIAQTYWTQRQTDLLALQTEILEAQALPQFTVRRDLEAGKDTITLENEGGPLRSVRLDVYDILYAEVFRPKGRSFGWAPILGYHEAPTRTVRPGAKSFALATTAGKRNVLTAFTREVTKYTYRTSTPFKREEAKMKPLGVLSMIRIQYVDLLGRDHVAWFGSATDFTTIGMVEVLPYRESEVRDTLKNWHYKDAVRVDRDLTPSVVCQLARQMLQNEHVRR